MRDPAGAAATLFTLGPSTHEQFTIEVVEGETDELAPEASWRKVATCTLRVTAVLKNPEAVTGLVEWEQEVEVTYEDGRQGVEARTRITTAEGTSAVTKAQTYARLTASSFGANFLYETNGPDGIEYTILDDDRPNSRVPTIVEAVSRIRGYGISFGTVTAGSAPSSVSYSVTTRRTTDDDGAIETQVVTRAEARGPGAAAFVSSRRPSVYTDYEEFEDAALDLATGTWTERRNTSGQKKPRFKVTITGGRAAEWEASMSGPPIYFHGGQGAYTATVDVIREFTGTTAALDSLKLPGPPEGWTVHQDESQEDDPELVQEGATVAPDDPPRLPLRRPADHAGHRAPARGARGRLLLLRRAGVSLPNTRIVITGTPRAEAAIQVVEISSREAKRSGEVLDRAAAAMSAKLRRELAQLKAELRRKAAR